MSTVLDADRELQKRIAPLGSPGVPPVGTGRNWRPITLLALALVAGGAGFVLLLPARDVPPAAPGLAAVPAIPPDVTSQQPARAPAVTSREGKEAPWGRVEKGASAPLPDARPVPAPPRVVAKPPKPRDEEPAVARRVREPAVSTRRPQAVVPDEVARPGAAAPAEELVAPHEPAAPDEAMVPDTPAPDAAIVPDTATMGRGSVAPDQARTPDEPAVDEPVAPARRSTDTSVATAEPRVRVSWIKYSPRRGDRSASLQVNGGRPVVLHEGESAEGVEVQLILRDTIYLRHGANVFAVGAAH